MKAPSSYHFDAARRDRGLSPASVTSSLLSPCANRGRAVRRPSRRRAPLCELPSDNCVTSPATTTTGSNLRISQALAGECNDLCGRRRVAATAAETERPCGDATAMMYDDDSSQQLQQLIGDFSKPCSLPVIRGKHADLPSISPHTVAN